MRISLFRCTQDLLPYWMPRTPMKITVWPHFTSVQYQTGFERMTVKGQRTYTIVILDLKWEYWVGILKQFQIQSLGMGPYLPNCTTTYATTGGTTYTYREIPAWEELWSQPWPWNSGLRMEIKSLPTEVFQTPRIRTDLKVNSDEWSGSFGWQVTIRRSGLLFYLTVFLEWNWNCWKPSTRPTE